MNSLWKDSGKWAFEATTMYVYVKLVHVQYKKHSCYAYCVNRTARLYRNACFQGPARPFTSDELRDFIEKRSYLDLPSLENELYNECKARCDELYAALLCSQFRLVFSQTKMLNSD